MKHGFSFNSERTAKVAGMRISGRPSYTYYAPRRQEAKVPTRPMRLPAVAAVGIIAVVVVSGAFFFGARHARAHEVTPSTKMPTVVKNYQSQLASTLTPILNGTTLDMSVSVVDLTSGRMYSYGDSDAYVSASIGKLLTACLVLRDVQQGTIKLSDTIGGSSVRVQLQQMIEVSDNEAWTVLNDMLGHPALQVYAKSIGLMSYDPAQNLFKSTDIAHLLQKLYKGQILNTQNTQILLGYMAHTDERQYIAAAAPENAKVYDKTGYLDDRLHDAAIVVDGHPYALVIFSKTTDGSDYDFIAAQKLFGSITQAVTSTFGT